MWTDDWRWAAQVLNGEQPVGFTVQHIYEEPRQKLTFKSSKQTAALEQES